jgi:hypothetical protein
MRERPAPVAIGDLAAPRFPESVLPIREAMAEMGAAVAIEPDVLTAAAIDQAGVDDFGDASFRQRLEVLCAAFDKDVTLSDAGRAAVFVQLTELLRNRLLVNEVLRRHPEIDELEVRAPVIICGLPRTGTTHLHNLLSADPALRSLPYWESVQPVLSDGAPDERVASTEVALEVLNTALPHFRRMHEMTPYEVHEEINLLAMDVSSMFFETMAPMA